MRVGVFTGGGDAPGLNAVIRSVVRRGDRVHGDEIIGYQDGWQGLFQRRHEFLTVERMRGTLPRGGTILGTSRTDPYRAGGPDLVRQRLAEVGIDALIAIGGEGTLSASARMAEDGISIVGVPKTIDNDIAATEATFGFHTAVQIATDAIDRLHTTAESHDRVMVVEVMGRHVGWIALYAGVAGGAAVILIPEVPFDIDDLCERIRRRHSQGRYATVVVVAEGAVPVPGTLDLPPPEFDQFGRPKLGGISTVIAPEIERRTGFDTRVTILGHVQRGGTPTAYDRMLATRYGLAAIDAVHDGAFGHMVALRADQIVRVPLAEVRGHLKTVPVELYRSVAEVFSL